MKMWIVEFEPDGNINTTYIPVKEEENIYFGKGDKFLGIEVLANTEYEAIEKAKEKLDYIKRNF